MCSRGNLQSKEWVPEECTYTDWRESVCVPEDICRAESEFQKNVHIYRKRERECVFHRIFTEQRVSSRKMYIYTVIERECVFQRICLLLIQSRESVPEDMLIQGGESVPVDMFIQSRESVSRGYIKSRKSVTGDVKGVH